MTPRTKALMTIALGTVFILGACQQASSPSTSQDKANHDMSGHDMAGHDMSTKSPAVTAANATPSTQAYLRANAAMHKDMDIAFSGDADQDFIASMLPHHQGAVAMAQVALQYGKDSEVKKLAQDIIAAQEKEIAFMTTWQEKRAAAAPSAAPPVK